MVKTIGNPLTWAADAVFGTSRSLGAATEAMASHETTPPATRSITDADIRGALRKGYDDFKTFRSDVMFLVAIYPLIGIGLIAVASNLALLPLLFPLAAGFALLGPVAAIGLYEMSRRREAGDEVGWGAALNALRAHVVGPVMALAVYLFAMFVLWILAAMLIYSVTLGPEPPTTVWSFARDVLTTGAGWLMIIIGMAVGFIFAAIVLVVSMVSFPMLIDRRAGIPVAVATSLQVAKQSPVTVAKWGLIVAVLMALGSLPFFLGLIIVLPVLGHATWHLYRAAVPRADHG
ncbi:MULTISPECIES: DUF2189 domain-containing protein [unclassified Roseovarius]|uniref:DUF2189 domain-containing protein n=1 Tax=unclassified Roseovarius TaxID=2614913 RepID=UPI00273F0BBB|nr:MULTISPECIES: DUF2189 domain-containing protein [unclassified Roseovarius]